MWAKSGHGPIGPRAARTSWRPGRCSPFALNEKQRAHARGRLRPQAASTAIPSNDARVQLLAFAAHHEERDKREEKRREAEAAAKTDEQGKTQEKIGEAVKLELEAEKQEQNRDGRGTGEAGGAGRQTGSRSRSPGN